MAFDSCRSSLHLLLLSWSGWGCVAPIPTVFFRPRRLHDAAVTEAVADSPVSARLHAFWRRVRGLHGRRAAAAWALRAALLAAGPVAVTILWWPSRWPAAVAMVAVVCVGAAMSGRLFVRQRLAVSWLQGLRAGPLGLADEFATWLELGPASAAPMAKWLEVDLDGRVAALTPPQFAHVGRRRVVGRRLVALAALLLLLAWLLAWWLEPRWPGLLGGRPPEPPPAAGGASGPVGEQPRAPQPEQPPQQPTDEPQPAPPEPPLPLPQQQHFVPPRFVGDGPSRKERVRAAELPTPDGPGAAPQKAAGSRAGVPTPTPEEFARAAENAQRARHVSPSEQPIVRRFFDLLQQAGK